MPRAGETTIGAGPDAIARAGITMRQLTYWIDRDLFTPLDLGSARPGIGRHRQLTGADVGALRVLRGLMVLRDTNNDTITQRIREIVRHAQVHGLHGRFELTRGVTVDLALLAAEPPT